MSADSYRTGRLFREFIAARLSRLTGLELVAREHKAMRQQRALSDRVAEETHIPAGDIFGTGWSIVTTLGTPFRPDKALHAAEVAARLDETDRFAAILARSGESPERAYVIMTLENFAAVVRGEGSAA